MSAVFLRAWTDFRSRWRAWVGLALIFGIAGGVAMTLAQGARRTIHAYPRFADAEHAADVLVAGKSNFGLVGAVDLDQVEATPYVAGSGRAFAAIPFTGRLRGHTLGPGDLFPIASADTRIGDSIEAWKMLSGRAADPDRVTETTASFVLADRLGLRVGSTIELRFFRAETYGAVQVGMLAGFANRMAVRHEPGMLATTAADGPTLRFRVVGIEASPAEFPPLINDLSPVLHLTPAFYRRYQASIVGSPISYIRINRGYDLRDFQLAVERLANGQPTSFVATRDNQSQKVERSIRAETLALAIVAGLVGLAGVIGVGQALVRQTVIESKEHPTLRALGMRESQLRAVSVLRAMSIALVGTIIAALIATLAWQLVLLRLARTAELHWGPRLDPPVIGVGTTVILVAALLLALRAARVASMETHGGAWHHTPGLPHMRGPRVDSRRFPFPLVPALGLRHSLQRGSAAQTVAAWSAVVATALSVAMLTGAITFTANLHRELTEPHRYGWNWDLKIGAPGLPDIGGILVPLLKRDPAVTGLSAGTVTQIDVSGARVDVLGLEPVTGTAVPTLIAGRAPRHADEIVLGARTMRMLDVKIGDFVRTRIGTAAATMHVVGRAVFHEFGDAGQLGTGSWTTLAGLQQLSPNAPRNTYFIQLGGGRGARTERELIARAFDPIPARFDARPEDLDSLARGDGLIVALGAMLALLAFVVLTHALVTSGRHHARDYAVLRTLGMLRRNVRLTVVVQMIALVVASLAIGIPIGVFAGHVAWIAFAHQLGIASDAVLSPAAVGIVLLATPVVGVLSAIIPGYLAGRRRPAEVFHRAR